MEERTLTIIEHIEEIRKRLITIVVFFAVAVIGGFLLAKPLIKFLQSNGPAADLPLNAFNVIDPIAIYLKVVVFIGIIIILPIIMYQFWAFVSPGLLETERRVTLSYIPFAFILFLSGIAFSYYVLLPYVIKFMETLSADLGITQTIGINQYFSFLFQILLPFGFVFQLPVVLLFLSRLGFLNPNVLSKFRKVAYFVLFVIAAFITPPDLVSHLFVTVPLFLLYEVSIIIARVGYKKFLKAEEKRRVEEEEAERVRLFAEAKAEQQRQIDEVNARMKDQD
ncbi:MULTISPECIES: twin-arginine translocase subunit TatC [unclassified Sporosarcina]|uniref:twin-arginine translocase subunit TatC n=1 Tax=unclassified Sporosarcina TaxID=2647733 RepID=UPI000579F942|nr:twin-arginine translocase subunit TatC [Sporosarcina sp. ZBG7A]VDG98628.1 Sec-independent protein translocase protein TatCy [Lysinibacillus sphaericus]